MSDVVAAPAAVPQPEHPRKKRRRLVVSCTECHRRKQKCDRGLPCANCRSRNKDSACEYEAPINTKDAKKRRASKSASPSVSGSDRPGEDGSLSSTVTSALGYSGLTKMDASILGFLRRIGTHDIVNSHGFSGPGSRGASLAVREKFKDLIRHLPSRTYMDRLVRFYIDKLNNQYSIVDEDIFEKQLAEWDAVPFQVLTQSGPEALSPDLRVFPAVLFQMVASALLIIPETGPLADEFAPLKYTASMSFVDLAADYSESGVAVVGLFGKSSLSVTTVQAGFLRAAFLKYSARVMDSWHTISMTIRDAQELGMHRDDLDPKPSNDSAEAVLENQWLIQRRRKFYMVLAAWDIHMSLLLGRPGSVDYTEELPTPPIDTVPPKDRSRTPVVPRNERTDPPTPLTGLLWLWGLSKTMRSVRALDLDGRRTKDVAKVAKVHQTIRDLASRIPGPFNSHNPDTRWDHEPWAPWMIYLRHYYTELVSTCIMLLYRPYLFQDSNSRRETVKASLDALEMGRRMFEGLAPDCWSNYHMFYGSFDAIVTLSIIYIVFPHENEEWKPRALQQFDWMIERFTAMKERNALARAAQGIIRVVYKKFTKAVGPVGERTSSSSGSLSTPAGASGVTTSTTTPATSKFSVTSPDTTMASGDVSGGTSASTGGSGDYWMPAAADLTSLAPLFPTYDLLFNDLSAADTGMMPSTALPPLGDDESPVQFDGEFGDDTVWQFLNQYDPTSFGTGTMD